MNEQNILIVRCGEVALKGMHQPYFDRMLVDRIKQNLKSFSGVDVRRHEGLIFVRAEKDLDLDAIIKEISKVFGVASISKAVEAPSELNAIGDEAVRYMMNLIEERGIKTFKVEGKRADKTFPVKSPEIGRIIGATVLVGCKVLKVDVHNPDVLLHVDVRSDRTYIYEGKIPGVGGLPLGTNGKGLTLADLGDAFHLDVGDRQGLLEGDIHLEGPLGAEASRFLSGSGRVAVTKGNLATLNFLAGLFDAMEKLPGMGRFVAQSRQATGIVISNSSMSYKLANGVLTSDDVTFRGGIFTIVAKGSYDYLRDELDFAVRVKIVKDDSFLGMLKNPILWPFSKLSSMFLGFRVSGSLEKPSWKYDMAILDRF